MLTRLQIQGFRSIREMDLELQPLNVMIGSNGAGKSNLISFFKMLNELMGQRLQRFFGTTGRASSNLYFGPKTTTSIRANLEFQNEHGLNSYLMQLEHAAGDSLVFTEEKISFQRHGTTEICADNLGSGHVESRLSEAAEQGNPKAKTLRYFLNSCRVYHFHDTSATAPMRGYSYLGDTRFLRPDAGNLAAMLCAYQQSNRMVFQRIVTTVQQVLPQLAEFVLENDRANPKEITLNWRRHNSDHLFGAHQLSDGSLRLIALITLLLQPEDELPGMIVLDEPELGLHPYALEILAELIRSASLNSRLLVATQSAALLGFFEPQDVLVVETIDEASQYRRLDAESLTDWLADYSLDELWNRNVLGGGPLP